MKRHPALIPLSRDHHEALILSRLIQADAPHYKGLPTETPGKLDYAINFFGQHLVDHFREEEDVFSLAKGFNNEMDSLINELVNEHERLSKMFNSLPASTDQDASLNTLGKFLESHIRKEERTLFPMMQKYIDDKRLDEISNLTKRSHEG